MNVLFLFLLPPKMLKYSFNSIYRIFKDIFTCNRVHIGAMILKNYWETIISPQIKMRWEWNLDFSSICSYWPDIELFTVANSSRFHYSAPICPVHDLMPVSHYTFMRISRTLSGLPGPTWSPNQISSNRTWETLASNIFWRKYKNQTFHF